MQYRFSPINSRNELIKVIEYLHIMSNQMCYNTFGRYLSNAGNVGIFCHFLEEYENLTKLRKELTFPSNNPDQKYFTL